MRKLAFSVWPKFPKYPEDVPPPYVLSHFEHTRGVLEDAGFDYKLVKHIDYDEVSIKLSETFSPGNKRKAANVSDYIRICEMVSSLEGVYDEVLYVDLDFHMWSPPSGYGCALESHFQTENGDDEIVKLWYRGINCVYYLHRDHLGILKRHHADVKHRVVTANYRPKYTYPMHDIWMIENEVGYIPGYWLFGPLSNPDFARLDYMQDIVHLAVYLGHMPKESLLEGTNLNGSHYSEKAGMSDFLDSSNRVRETLQANFPRRSIEEIREDLSNARVRVNYNNIPRKREIQQFLRK